MRQFANYGLWCPICTLRNHLPRLPPWEVLQRCNNVILLLPLLLSDDRSLFAWPNEVRETWVAKSIWTNGRCCCFALCTWFYSVISINHCTVAHVPINTLITQLELIYAYPVYMHLGQTMNVCATFMPYWIYQKHRLPEILQIIWLELRALSILATICLITSELACLCTLQRQRIRELALSLQATLTGSQPHCTMAPFFSLTLSYIIIAMYWGKIMICTSIQPGWHAS